MPDEKPDAINKAKVVWQKETGELQEFLLNMKTVTSIGREPRNDIVLPAKNVSKQHAMILWKENGFAVADRGSANGVIVNGMRIKEPALLKDGDRIEIGDYVLRFSIIAEKPVAEMSTMVFTDIQPEEQAISAEAGEVVSERATMIFRGSPAELIGTEGLPAQQMTEPVAEEIRVEPEIEPKAVEVEQVKEKQPVEEQPMMRPQPIEAELPVVEKAPESTEIDEIFKGLLLQQTQIFNAAAQAIKDKGKTTHTKLLSINDQLGTVTQEMVTSEQKLTESNLPNILTKLAQNPNDVTLLVELAKHSDLIRMLVTNTSTHTAKVIHLKLALNAELEKMTL